MHAYLSHPGDVDFDITAQPDFWSRTNRLGMAGDDLTFTSPTDLMLHLIVHAAHDHTFNNGPLILSDSASPANMQSTPIPGSGQLTAAGLMLAEPETSFLLKFRHELADQGNPTQALWILVLRFFPERARIAMTYPVREDSPKIGLYYLR